MSDFSLVSNAFRLSVDEKKVDGHNTNRLTDQNDTWD